MLSSRLVTVLLTLALVACDDPSGAGQNANNANNVNNLNNLNNANNANNQDPLQVSIASPSAGTELLEGRTLHLAATVSGGQPPYQGTWELLGVGPVASGVSPGDLQMTEPGAHTLEVTVTDAAGHSASASVPVLIVDFNGGLRPYFGHLHSHSAISDGEGTPDEVLTWARDVVGVDFYAMTDHAEQMSNSEWTLVAQKTAEYSQPGVFVALRGFEWSHPWNGHMCIFDTADFTSAISDIWISYIYDWLVDHQGLAQFNHPGRENGVFDDLDYESAVAPHMFAIETGNRGNGNAGGEFLPYYIRALDKGWRLAPTSNQDNHSLNFNSHRTAYWAAELSQESLLQAMRDRAFYSSDDPNVEVLLRVGDVSMGGILTPSAQGPLEFQIKVADDEPIQRLELITRSGAVAAMVEPPAGATRFYWFPVVNVSSNGWYFLKVTSEDVLDGEGPVQVAVTPPIYIRF